jgi:hypothetical protein
MRKQKRRVLVETEIRCNGELCLQKSPHNYFPCEYLEWNEGMDVYVCHLFVTKREGLCRLLRKSPRGPHEKTQPVRCKECILLAGK